jgi:hypothetical protein
VTNLEYIVVLHEIRTPQEDLINEEQEDFYTKIFWTLPTLPSRSLTFIPLGCLPDLVSMSLTMPLVSLPVRWSLFSTIRTSTPLVTSLLIRPSFPMIHPSTNNPLIDDSDPEAVLGEEKGQTEG